MENLRVRRAGYAYRRSYDTFLKRYKSLCPATWPIFRGPAKEGVKVLMDYLQVAENVYAMGKTKIFMRLPQEIFQIEDAFQRRKNELVTKIIAVWKGQRQRKQYLKDRSDIITVQTQVRGHLAVKRLSERKKASTQIREFIKGFITRHEQLSPVNRKFWIQTRMNYLMRLAKSELPKTVLHKSWPSCQPSMQTTSDLLRKLHMKNRVLKYCKNCLPVRKFAMDEKVLAEKLFKGEKILFKIT